MQNLGFDFTMRWLKENFSGYKNQQSNSEQSLANNGLTYKGKKKSLDINAEAFFIGDRCDILIFFLVFLYFLKIDIAQRCNKANQNRYNSYKNVSTITYILLKHIELFKHQIYNVVIKSGKDFLLIIGDVSCSIEWFFQPYDFQHLTRLLLQTCPR